MNYLNALRDNKLFNCEVAGCHKKLSLGRVINDTVLNNEVGVTNKSVISGKGVTTKEHISKRNYARSKINGSKFSESTKYCVRLVFVFLLNYDTSGSVHIGEGDGGNFGVVVVVRSESTESRTNVEGKTFTSSIFVVIFKFDAGNFC